MKQIAEPTRHYVSAAELASMIGLTEDAIWRYARRGVIPHGRIGSHYIFNPETVFKALEENERQ